MCGVSTVFGAVRSGWSRGQRLDVVHVERRRRRSRRRAERGEQAGLVDERAARGVDEVGRTSHRRAARAAPMMPAGPVAEPQVQGDHVGAGQQLVLGHRRHAVRAGRLRVEVLATRPAPPSRRRARPGPPGWPRRPSPSRPSVAPVEVGADGVLPAARPQAVASDCGHLAQQGEDQRPGQLGGRAGQAAGAADRDAAPLRRRDVDRRVGRAGRDQQPQVAAAGPAARRRTASARASRPRRRRPRARSTSASPSRCSCTKSTSQPRRVPGARTPRRTAGSRRAPRPSSADLRFEPSRGPTVARRGPCLLQRGSHNWHAAGGCGSAGISGRRRTRG